MVPSLYKNWCIYVLQTRWIHINLEGFHIITLSGSPSYFVHRFHWNALDLLFPSVTFAIIFERLLPCYKEVTSTLFVRYYTSSLPVITFKLPSSLLIFLSSMSFLILFLISSYSL